MTTTPQTPKKGNRAERTFTFDTRAVDEEARTVELAFSSETDVERWYGIEQLSHDPGAVRLERMNDGAALLVNHDSSQQVGVVESARVDKDKVGRAVVRFGRGAFADEVFRDVIDGIRTKVSVGYIIHAEPDATPIPGGGMRYRITDWEPLEASLVAIPADASVGVDRSLEAGKPNGDPEMDDDIDAQKRDTTTTGAPEKRDGEVTQADLDNLESRMKAEGEEKAKAEAKRDSDHAEIRELGKRYGLEKAAEDLIGIDATPAEMREAVKQSILTRSPQPVPAMSVQRVTGGIPRHHGKLVAFGNAEADLERAYTVGMWARGFLFGDVKAREWCAQRMDTRAMAAGINSKGGVFVPDEMADAMIDLREKYGIARQIADVWPMSSDTLWIPRWTGDVTASFVGENQEISSSDPSFDGVQLVARKIAALTLIPEELLEDAGAVINLADRVTNNMAWAFAKKEDECLIDGDGTSTYGGIMGLRPKIIDGTHTAGAIDAASDVDTFGEVTATDLAKVRAALPEYAEMGGEGPEWLSSKTGKNLTFDRLTAAAGGMTMSMFGERPQDAYLGDRIRSTQAMPKGATTDYSNVAMLFYGNFRMGVSMGSRREFTVKVLEERYAEYDQIGIRATERFDLNVHGLGDTSNAGPIVGLIGE
jgi:HK97 family phage major capsid protein